MASEELEKAALTATSIYSKKHLSHYDFLVLGLSNHLVWKCPTSKILKLYKRHISSNHMEVGVGTGFFLDHCMPSSADPRLVLVDLKRDSLEVTQERIRRFSPTVYQRNILNPLKIDEEAFDSIGINYLLHCLPGNIYSKAKVFEHVNAYLNPKGRVFGSTLLHGGVKRSILAKLLMKLYNRKGIFTNTNDNLEGLRTVLEQNYARVHIEVQGCAALFWAQKS